jgi:hypothetical protein
MEVPKRILLYRITHYQNLEFILQNGMHCPNSPFQDPNYINIGKKDIINKRSAKPVRLYPSPGMINEYVPFYFCYRSPMLGSIKVGNSDFKGTQDEIIYLVTDLNHIKKHSCEFVFTDGQALIAYSKFFDDESDFDKLDWEAINSNQWGGNQSDNDKMRRKMAEFLVKDYVPIEALIGIAVMNQQMEQTVTQIVTQIGADIPIIVKTDWYF